MDKRRLESVFKRLYELFRLSLDQYKLINQGGLADRSVFERIIHDYQSFYEAQKKQAKGFIFHIDKPADYYCTADRLDELMDILLSGMNYTLNLLTFKKDTFKLPTHPLMFTIIALFSGKYIKLPETLLNKPPHLRTIEEQKTIDEIINSIVKVEFSGKRNSMGESIHTISYLVTDNHYVRCLANFENTLFKDDIDFQNESIAFAIKRAFGAEGLKHMLGFFIAMQENYNNRYFIFDINKHLEILKYKKHWKGGYDNELKKRASEIIQVLCSLKLTVESKNKNKEIINTQKLLLFSGNVTFKEFGEVINTHIYITPNPAVFTYSDNSNLNEPFTRLLKSIAGVNHKEHPITIYLGTLLPIFWRISGKEQSLSLRSIFKWLDIDVNNHKYLMRHLKNLLNELDYMVKNHFLGHWYVRDNLDVFNMLNPLDAVFIFHPPKWYKVGMLDLFGRREQHKHINTKLIDVDTIKHIMETKKLTVREFANSINVNKRTIYYILAGKHPITKRVSDKIKSTYTL